MFFKRFLKGASTLLLLFSASPATAHSYRPTNSVYTGSTFHSNQGTTSSNSGSYWRPSETDMNERRGSHSYSSGSAYSGGYSCGSSLGTGTLDSMFRLSGQTDIPPVALWNDVNFGAAYYNAANNYAVAGGNPYPIYGAGANGYFSNPIPSYYGSSPYYGAGSPGYYGNANPGYYGGSANSYNPGYCANNQANTFIPAYPGVSPSASSQNGAQKTWRDYFSVPGSYTPVSTSQQLSSSSLTNSVGSQLLAYNSNSRSGSTTYQLGAQQSVLADAKTLSIDSYISKIENRLLHLHEIDALGSMDMDYFSEGLLAIKKNYAEMLSVTATLSAREQSLLKSQLSSLERELASRSAPIGK